MATPFDRLMTTIRPHLPGAMDEAIRQELFLVCDDFFNRSDAWQERIDFDVPAGTEVGEIMPFAGRVLRLAAVEYDGRPVRGATMGEPDISGALPIKLPYPSLEPHKYTATVVLTVSDPTTRDAYPIVPSEIVTRYTADLMHGVLARMMVQPSKPYTNMALAQFHNTKFTSGAARAKNAMRAGNTNGSQAWAFPQTISRRK